MPIRATPLLHAVPSGVVVEPLGQSIANSEAFTSVPSGNTLPVSLDVGVVVPATYGDVTNWLGVMPTMVASVEPAAGPLAPTAKPIGVDDAVSGPATDAENQPVDDVVPGNDAPVELATVNVLAGVVPVGVYVPYATVAVDAPSAAAAGEA